jgi:organic hydroperoxide reductase OsmC/OhrA
MTELKREATIRWMNRPPEGVPRLTVGSASFTALPLNVDRLATHPLATSPGELLAAAVGATFAWYVADQLMTDGVQARELTAYVTLTLSCDSDDDADLALSAIRCRLWGRVPRSEQAHLEVVARAAMAHCMKSLGMHAERIAVSVEVTLEGP